uniref:Dolichyl-diphosphooligosaccharide--protein glycosyltransferase subunit DAD1 n=1 Tax=Cairina moschata TaxID=8855 RepID=A0A8C3CAF9_CAIMO
MLGAAGSGGAGSVGLVGSVVWRFLAEYGSSMPSCLKVLDAYLLYVLLTSALQFNCCLGISTFPFNPFLSGFISTIGSFILSSQCGPCAVSPGSQGVKSPPNTHTHLAVAIEEELCLEDSPATAY